MNIRDAVLRAKEKNGVAVLDRSTPNKECVTQIYHIAGRMGTLAGGGTYDAFCRTFNGNSENGGGIMQGFSWEEITSNDWIVATYLITKHHDTI